MIISTKQKQLTDGEKQTEKTAQSGVKRKGEKENDEHDQKKSGSRSSFLFRSYMGMFPTHSPVDQPVERHLFY